VGRIGGSGLNRLVLAQVDAAGDVVTAPKPVLASEQPQNAPLIAASGDGYGLVWVEYDEGDPLMRFARLDAAGDLVGTARRIDTGTGSQITTFVSIGDGFALTFLTYAGGTSVTALAALDAEGALRRAPVPLTDYYSARPDLLVRDGKLLVAWSHATGGYENSDIASTIRFGWFDANGNPTGETYQVQAPVEDEENVDPHWSVIGDDLGLTWARGGVIYICAGCIPDNRLEFVVLDGETFEPRSNVVSIENQETNGGLLNPKLAVDGADLRVVTAVTYHVSAAVGTALIHCE
jgi:hypothetical protein